MSSRDKNLPYEILTLSHFGFRYCSVEWWTPLHTIQINWFLIIKKDPMSNFPWHVKLLIKFFLSKGNLSWRNSYWKFWRILIGETHLDLSWSRICYWSGSFPTNINVYFWRIQKPSISSSCNSWKKVLEETYRIEKLVKWRSGHTEMITSDLQRVFPYDHSVIWQVFFDLQSFLMMAALLLLLYENVNSKRENEKYSIIIK